MQGTVLLRTGGTKQADQIIDDWANLVSKIITTSDAKRKKHGYLPDRQEDFYKFKHVSHEEFEKSCNSLDIILFKSQHRAVRVQRFFTDSEYGTSEVTQIM